MEPLLTPVRRGLQGGELGFNEPRHLDTLWHSGNSQTPAAPWGQWRAFYLLSKKLEQSGAVTAPTTTNGLQIFPDQDFGLETP